MKTFFNVLDKLYAVFAEPSNHHRFIEMQKALKIKQTEIVKPSETRWACKWRCVNSVKKHYSAITNTLKEMRDEGEKWAIEATGLYNHINRVEFITCLVVFEDLLRVVHVAHKALQSTSCTLADATKATSNLRAHVVSRRDEDAWKEVWCTVKELCQTSNAAELEDAQQGVPDELPCKRKRLLKPLVPWTVTLCILHWDKSEGETHTETSKSSAWKMQQHLYLPVLDAVISELDRRFMGETIDLAKACDAVFKCEKVEIDHLLKKYAEPLCIHPLLVRVETDFAKASATVTPVAFTNFQNTVKKGTYPNLYKLLQLALTLPVGSATSERSFSAMRRIRNWLRTTMSEHRFSDLGILHIEAEITATLSPE